MFKKIIISTLAVIAMAPSASAIGLGSAARTVKPTVSNAQRAAPIAYQVFCKGNPSECKADSTQRIAYTPQIADLIKQVNASVNRAISPRNETTERWQINVSSGDCEDYALTKRSQLMKRGVPAGALRMAVVFTEKRELHAVLLVRTTNGDFVLDNRRNDVRKKSNTGYIFAMIASSNPLIW